MLVPYCKQGEMKAVPETPSSSDCRALTLAPPVTSLCPRANPAGTASRDTRPGHPAGGGLLAGLGVPMRGRGWEDPHPSHLPHFLLLLRLDSVFTIAPARGGKAPPHLSLHNARILDSI